MIRNAASAVLVIVAFGVFIYSSEYPAESTIETVLHAVTALLITLAVLVQRTFGPTKWRRD